MDQSNISNSGSGRLETYLLSDGTQLPADYKQYWPGKPKHQTCLFCSNEGSRSVYQYEMNTSRAYGMDTKTLCCKDCFEEIRVMEETLPGPDIRIPEDNRREDIEWTIYDYIDHDYLPNGWTYRLSHVEFNPHRYECFFCHAGVNPLVNHQITVPVIHQNYLTGGKARVCNDCMNTYMKYIHKSGKFDREVQDCCTSCREDYVINAEEFVYRQGVRSMSKHMCPACTYALIVEEGGTEYYDEEGFFRFVPVPCSCCSEDIYIDQTFDPAWASSLHKGKTGFVCWECQLEGDEAARIKAQKKPVIAIDGRDKLVLFYEKYDSNSILVRTKIGKKGQALTTIRSKDLLEYLLNIQRELKNK